MTHFLYRAYGTRDDRMYYLDDIFCNYFQITPDGWEMGHRDRDGYDHVVTHHYDILMVGVEIDGRPIYEGDKVVSTDPEDGSAFTVGVDGHRFVKIYEGWDHSLPNPDLTDRGLDFWKFWKVVGNVHESRARV